MTTSPSEVLNPSLDSFIPGHSMVDWDQDRLQKEWSFWDESEREWYMYWIDLYKEHRQEVEDEKGIEIDPLDPARMAAHKVLERRRGGWRS